MRNFVIALAAAGSALAFASPAAAQYYPQQQPYGYGAQPYGYNAYGHNNGYGQVRALQARIDALQYRIRYMGGHNGIRGKSAKRLRDESRSIEHRLRSAQYNGLSPYEASDIHNRIVRLEQRVNYAMAGRSGRYGNAGYNAYNGNNGYSAYSGNGHYGDRDRDDDDRDYDRDDDRGHDRDDDD